MESQLSTTMLNSLTAAALALSESAVADPRQLKNTFTLLYRWDKDTRDPDEPIFFPMCSWKRLDQALSIRSDKYGDRTCVVPAIGSEEEMFGGYNGVGLAFERDALSIIFDGAVSESLCCGDEPGLTVEDLLTVMTGRLARMSPDIMTGLWNLHRILEGYVRFMCSLTRSDRTVTCGIGPYSWAGLADAVERSGITAYLTKIDDDKWDQMIMYKDEVQVACRYVSAVLNVVAVVADLLVGPRLKGVITDVLAHPERMMMMGDLLANPTVKETLMELLIEAGREEDIPDLLVHDRPIAEVVELLIDARVGTLVAALESSKDDDLEPACPIRKGVNTIFTLTGLYRRSK